MSEEDYKKIFSKNLKYFMDQKGISQMDLVNDLQLSQSTVSNWCTGLKLPRMNKIQMLADYFGIEKSDLLEHNMSSEMSFGIKNEEKYQEIFSKNLRYYMSTYNKTQTDIINELNINKSAISTWVNGTRLPRMDKIDMLAKYFHINRSDLLEEKSESEMSRKSALDLQLEERVLNTFSLLNTENQIKGITYAENLLTNQQMEEALSFPTSTLMAAHNDRALEPEELEKMKRDMERLKRPGK